MPYETIEKARKGIRHEQEAARLIAEEQERNARGFSRTPAFTPQPRARNPYQPEAERPAPSVPYKSEPLRATGEEKPKTKRRSFGVGYGD